MSPASANAETELAAEVRNSYLTGAAEDLFAREEEATDFRAWADQEALRYINLVEQSANRLQILSQLRRVIDWLHKWYEMEMYLIEAARQIETAANPPEAAADIDAAADEEADQLEQAYLEELSSLTDLGRVTGAELADIDQYGESYA